MASKRGGWIPQQHGAWAMLVVPLAVGLVVRGREGLPGWAWPLAVTWLVGYFCFNAAGLWLKAAPTRRASFLPPLLTHGAIAGLAGVTTLALGGLPLLWWVPVYIPLLGAALWLTAHRRERSLWSGLCTVLAACLLAWILPFRTPQELIDAGPGHTSWLAPALFGYFFGTVFVVKTLIRERNKPGWVLASVLWHLVWAVISVAARQQGVAGWGWAGFFLVGAARAWALPWFGPRRGRTIRPGQVGMLEVLMSLVALALCLA